MLDRKSKRTLAAALVSVLIIGATSPVIAQQSAESGVGVYVAPPPVDLLDQDLDKTEPLMGLELANIVRRLEAVEAENEILRNRILAVEAELARDRKE